MVIANIGKWQRNAIVPVPATVPALGGDGDDAAVSVSSRVMKTFAIILGMLLLVFPIGIVVINLLQNIYGIAILVFIGAGILLWWGADL